MDGLAIETPLGDSLGKLVGLILDLETWKTKKLVVSPGMLKTNVAYRLNDISEFKESDKKIIIKPDVEHDDLPEYSTTSNMLLKDLMAKKVVTSDDEKLKSFYDIDIATQLKSWDVWKLLIQTPVKERRLRISPKNIEKVADHIILKLSMEDIEKREEGEE